jgi:hypothetical protein
MVPDLQEKLACVMRCRQDTYLMSNSLDIDLSGDWVFSNISFENLNGGSLKHGSNGRKNQQSRR